MTVDPIVPCPPGRPLLLASHDCQAFSASALAITRGNRAFVLAESTSKLKEGQIDGTRCDVRGSTM